MTIPEPRHVTIRLAIAVGTDPIEGSLTIGEQEPRDFYSWLDLIAALDAAKKGGSTSQKAGRDGKNHC
jgi:hypothetical protein